MASIHNTFDLRNPYTSSGMINSQSSMFSQPSSQPPQSGPQPIPSKPDYHSGATDYSISSFSRIPSAYPLQQLMQQSSRVVTESPFRKPQPQSDFLSDLHGFVGNGCMANGEFANPHSLQAAAALAAQNRPLYRSFNTEASPLLQPTSRLIGPPFSYAGSLPSRGSVDNEQTLGDSKSLGALLREIAGVPASNSVSSGVSGTINTLRQANISGSGRIGDIPRYDNTSIPGFGGVSDQSLLGQQQSEGFLDTLTCGTSGRLPLPPRCLFQSPSNSLQNHHSRGMMSSALSPPTPHQTSPPSHQQYFISQANQPQSHGAPPPPGIFQAPRIANSVQAAAAVPASGPMTSISNSSDITNRLGPPPCFMSSSMTLNNVDEDDPPRGRKKRKPYTRYQTMVLENEYLVATYITRQKRWEISCKLHLTERQVKVWFQNRRMKSKKLQARAPNLNSTGNKLDNTVTDERLGGTDDAGGGSRSGCPSTVSSLDSSAPSQHPNSLPPPYNSGVGGGGAYHGIQPSFHFSSSLKIDPNQSPGQQSDGKDSVSNDFSASINNSQPPGINPFETPKLQRTQSVLSGAFDPPRRFDISYSSGIHMSPPPPFNSSTVGAPPFALPPFLQHPQAPPPPPPRTRDV